MAEKVTVDNLERISQMLGNFETKDKNAICSDYDNELIKTIKENLLNKTDFSVDYYFNNAKKCLDLGRYHASKLYLENGIIKSYKNLDEINKIKHLAYEIYSKNKLNPLESFDNALNLAKKLSTLDF